MSDSEEIIRPPKRSRRRLIFSDDEECENKENKESLDSEKNDDSSQASGVSTGSTISSLSDKGFLLSEEKNPYTESRYRKIPADVRGFFLEASTEEKPKWKRARKERNIVENEECLELTERESSFISDSASIISISSNEKEYEKSDSESSDDSVTILN